MNNNQLVGLVAVLVIIGGVFYYQKHTHTASINLPGNNDISITTHD